MRLTAVLLSALLTACVTDAQVYSSIDQNERTVTVPAGGAGLLGEIKERLSEAGWRMTVYRGPQVTRGSVGQNTDLETSDTFNTRYNLIVSSRQYDVCLNLQPMIQFDVSLIDNRSGQEVLTMSGNGCESGVADDFSRRIQG